MMKTAISDKQRKAWGDDIRQARRARNLTQEQLARLWGGTLSYVQKIEIGAKGNAETYEALMALLDPPRRKKAS